jgi:hypothetical protein
LRSSRARSTTTTAPAPAGSFERVGSAPTHSSNLQLQQGRRGQGRRRHCPCHASVGSSPTADGHTSTASAYWTAYVPAREEDHQDSKELRSNLAQCDATKEERWSMLEERRKRVQNEVRTTRPRRASGSALSLTDSPSSGIRCGRGRGLARRRFVWDGTGTPLRNARPRGSGRPFVQGPDKRRPTDAVALERRGPASVGGPRPCWAWKEARPWHEQVVFRSSIPLNLKTKERWGWPSRGWAIIQQHE